MWRIPLQSEDTALLLSPRWESWNAPWQLTLAILFLAGPIVLAAWLYRNELKLVPRSLAVVLLGLRLVLLIFLGLLVFFQPRLARFWTEEEPSRVLLAVDLSRSMSVADPQRDILEKLRLARALGLPEKEDLPAEALLDKWVEHYQKKGGSEPEWLTDDEKMQAESVRDKLEKDRRNLHDRICKWVDGWQRKEIAQRILASSGLGLAARLAKDHRLDVLGFHQQTWETPPDRLLGDGRDWQEVGTDLHAPLKKALEITGQKGERLLGVVLFTDGKHNAESSPLELARELGLRKVPIFPVALGARRAPSDLAVLDISPPGKDVFKDAEVAIEAKVKTNGILAQDLVVELHHKGKVLQEKTIKHEGPDRTYHVSFPTKFYDLGTQIVEIKVRPTLQGTPEATQDNNSLATFRRVIQDKPRILLIDDEARWEYHYLASALVRARDPTLDVEQVLFTQPRVGLIKEEILEKIGNPKKNLPPLPSRIDPSPPGGKGSETREEDPLRRFDCIVLGDVAPDQLPLADRKRLERYVSEGGNLVILAGKRHMPLGYFKAPEDELAKMIPISQFRVLDDPAGFALSLAPEGHQTPFLQLEADAQENVQTWSGFPRHFWGVAGEPKPGASTLIVAVPEKSPSSKALEKTQGIFVLQPYGSGRVLYVGLESTWRWRFRVGDYYHHRFWGQVAIWAASDRLLPAGNKYVRYGSRDPIYSEGKEVELMARLGEGVSLSAGARVEARLLRKNADGKEEPLRVVPLARNENQLHVFKGHIRDLPPGEYRIDLTIPEIQDKLREKTNGQEKESTRLDTFIVQAASHKEMEDLALDLDAMQKLAQASGGQVFLPENAADLANLLARHIVKKEISAQQKIWQDPPLVWWLLGLVLLVLTVEWVARKWAGLP